MRLALQRANVCPDLTGVVRAEVHFKDVVAEVREVLQLFEMALQMAAGKTRSVQRSNEAKHKGIQTGWPVIRNTHRHKPPKNKHVRAGKSTFKVN